MKSKHYDAIIIGAGQAGVPLAKKLAKAGKRVALIEKRWIGGTCINDGCTPTKAWVGAAKAVYTAANSTGLGVTAKSLKVDMVKIKARKDKIVKDFREGAQRSLEKTPRLDLIFGNATFIDVKMLTVTLADNTTKNLTADLIFINTGGYPFVPTIEGLDRIDYLTSTTILDLAKVPKHLLVVGGNYVGLEFAQMFRRFGSKVTVVEQSARIMSKEDADISAEVKKILTRESIDVLTSAKTLRFETKGKRILTTIKKGREERVIDCSHVLMATGRRPQTASLALERTGVKVDKKGYVKVNARLATNVKGIYALGDVNGGPQFTHIAYNDYVIVYKNLIENGHYTTKKRLIPYCMFTDPELGRVGITETEAKEKGIKFKVVRLPMSSVARAIENGDTRGLLKALVDPDTKKILGAAFLGAQGGELMSVLQMAIEGGLTYDKLAYGVFAHPLYAEALNNLFAPLED